MEALLVLLGLVILAIPVAVIYLLISHAGLTGRVRDLEAEVTRLQLRSDMAPASEAGPAPATEPEPAPPAEPAQANEDNTPPAAKVIAARRARAREMSGPIAKMPPAGGPSWVSRGLSWLMGHWIYAVSALSLALAGLYLVQYGVENGFFPPAARILAALAFGGALIAAGELIRRRFGDGVGTSTAYLPSVFSGAGLVSLFGAVVAARLLYGLIGVELAFAGLVAVGVLGLGLGWINGPLLAGIGVLGAFASPFLVGSEVPATPWLFVYFGIVTAVGLGIDTLRRWAWVSGLSAAMGLATGVLTYIGGFSGEMALAAQIYFAVQVALAVLIPSRGVWPDHAEPMLLHALIRKGRRPSFPVLMAWAVLAAATFMITGIGSEDQGMFWSGIVVLSVLVAAFSYWSHRARGLQDASLVPLAGLLTLVALEGSGAEARAFAATYTDNVEADFPFAVSILVALGVGLSVLALWRALRPGEHVAWTIAAAVIAPAVAIILEVTWTPAETIGAYAWALHGAVLAAVMTQFSVILARVDGADRLRASICVMSALAALTFAVVLILSDAALTVALAALVVAAAALDRRFDLPLMQVFISIGVVAVGARLVAFPGLGWALDQAAFWEMLLAYGGALAACVAALWLLRGMTRMTAQVMLDTGAWSSGGMLASLSLLRSIELLTGRSAEGHWEIGLFATIWIILALVQLLRFEALGGRLRWVRAGLAGVFGLIGLAAVLASLTVFNPLLDAFSGPVFGPVLINTLLPAYFVPALVLLLASTRIQGRIARWGVFGLGCALAAFWAFAALRHAWQGAATLELSYGFLQGELWSYTLALLGLGAALFYQSLARGSVVLRRAGLLVIGLAVAKVFLVDISGLTGLTRVLSLAVLGLSLAALAWLDRWAQGQAEPHPQ
ncbi:MAG: DUF2339 domain-containing protein [Pseudomonadota bacterium]